jgi:hypothetical protein
MSIRILTFVIISLLTCVSYGGAAEEQLDRVFHFVRTESMQDRQQIATVIRSISEMRDVSDDTANGSLTLRGTTTQISVADWLFQKLENATQQRPALTTNEFRPSNDDDVVRVFYLTHIDTLRDLQEMSTVVRSMTDVRKLFSYTSQRVITLRGTAAQIALAEWLFKELDKPDQQAVTRSTQAAASEEFRPSNGDDVVRVFYRTGADTPQALQEIVSQVRSRTEIRRAFLVNSQRAVAMRGTAAQIAHADRLFKERDNQ